MPSAPMPDLRAVVTKAPGQRIPRTVDEQELAVRAVLGQQVSTKAARTHAGRLARAYGTAVTDTAGGLTHAFPSIAQLADIDPAHLGVPDCPPAFADGAGERPGYDGELVLDAGCDWDRARTQLLGTARGSVPGLRRSSRCVASAIPMPFRPPTSGCGWPLTDWACRSTSAGSPRVVRGGARGGRTRFSTSGPPWIIP